MAYKLSPAQSQEMAAAIRANAERLGINPSYLAAAMSFETGGTLDPWKAGPTTKYGQHHGLIQWGGPQAREYGVGPNSSITDQVNAAGKYLADRGVKPGHGMTNIYSAILHGDANSGFNVRDKNGTSASSGAQRMLASEHANALANLDRAGGQTQTASADPNAQLGRTTTPSSSGTVQPPERQVPLPPQRGDGLNRLMNRSGPAAVDAAPATPQQVADPKLQVMNYAPTEAPKGSALNQINPLDPSGPLLKQPGGPAPVNAPPATPQEIAQPRFANTLQGLGLETSSGVTQAPRQANIMNNFPMNVGGSRDMMGETPYGMNMAGMPLTPSVSSAPITPLSSAPAISLPIPETPPMPQVTNGTGGTPIATPGGDSPDVSGGGSTPPTDPGPTTPGSGGEGIGGMMEGLASALENFGGGGEGGGGGGQPQPQVDPTGGMGALASVPDFPSAGGLPQQIIAQKAMQVSQPELMQGPLFQLKPIGQQGPQPAPIEFSDAHSATKRLFGRA